MSMNMRWRLNRCRRRQQNLGLLACGLLPETERAPLEAHLAGCASCRQYYEDAAWLSEHLRQWAAAGPAAEVSPALRARWTRSLQADRAPTRSSLSVTTAAWREWLWPSPLAWGGLVAVWVLILCLQQAAPARPSSNHQVAASQPAKPPVTLTERQRELSSLLKDLVPSPPLEPDAPRPRSQRALLQVAT